MAYDAAFSPWGRTYLVGTSPVQVPTTNNDAPTSYRVRNLSASQQYFTWTYDAPGSPTPTITVTVPSAGSPSTNTIGMAPYTVEVFGTLPPNAWFQANAAGAFEITAGEGL